MESIHYFVGSHETRHTERDEQSTTVMTKEGKHSGERKISDRSEQATAAMANGWYIDNGKVTH